MTPEKLEVGKFYREGANKCLAIGMRKLFTGKNYGKSEEFEFKHLVIVDNHAKEGIGKCIQEGDNALSGTWENITEWDEEKDAEILTCNPYEGMLIAFIP